jgi:hypothetical protein
VGVVGSMSVAILGRLQPEDGTDVKLRHICRLWMVFLDPASKEAGDVRRAVGEEKKGDHGLVSSNFLGCNG